MTTAKKVIKVAAIGSRWPCATSLTQLRIKRGKRRDVTDKNIDSLLDSVHGGQFI
jgi:hypothetical protein